MTIGKQLTILITGFAIALPTGTLVLSVYHSKVQQATRKVAAEGNARTSRLFAILQAVSRSQETTQRLLREKDPDRIETMVADVLRLAQEGETRLRGLSEGAGTSLEA